MSAEVKVINEAKLHDNFNLVALSDCDKFAIDKDGQFTAVMQFNLNFSDNLDDERYHQLFNIRKQAFELIGDDCYFSIHSLRRKYEYFKESDIEQKTVRDLTNVWNKQFTHSYQTTHYLIVTTKNKTLLAKTIAKQQDFDINKLESLENKVNELLSRLAIYNLSILKGHELISHWASILNGREVFVKTDSYLFDEYITNTDVFFESKKNYATFSSNNNQTFSCFLSIKAYPRETTNKLFHELQKLNIEFNIYQHYFSEDQLASVKKLDEKIRFLNNLPLSRTDKVSELLELRDVLEDGELKLLTQVWNVQIFANSLEELNASALKIQTEVERRGLMLLRESKNLEACFWSVFPTNEHLRIRQYQITSDNLAHFITLASDNSGLNKSSWGNEAVCQFYTSANSVFNFNFHKTDEENALGHTMVIGESGIGKTVLISFLLSQAMKFDNFKCMAFDKGNGLKVFADIIGAEYSDFSGDNQNINPLQLPEKDITFLQSWLEDLLNITPDSKDYDENVKVISEAIKQNYNLPKKDRSFENIEIAFGKKGAGSIRNKLKTWTKDGANGAYFNGKTDSLDFNSPFTFFDTTKILSNKPVLGAVSNYLFFKIHSKILSDPSPHIIFVDEVNEYLESEQFRSKLKMTAAERRKANGILVMAAQAAKTVFDNEVFQEMKPNIATYILFPDHRADAKYYIDEIGLTNAEFRWIKTAVGRQVIVKKTDAETVVLNIDLSSLGKYLKVFDSSTKTVKLIKQLQQQDPTNWVNNYLNKEK